MNLAKYANSLLAATTAAQSRGNTPTVYYKGRELVVEFVGAMGMKIWANGYNVTSEYNEVQRATIAGLADEAMAVL